MIVQTLMCIFQDHSHSFAWDLWSYTRLYAGTKRDRRRSAGPYLDRSEVDTTCQYLTISYLPLEEKRDRYHQDGKASQYCRRPPRIQRLEHLRSKQLTRVYIMWACERRHRCFGVFVLTGNPAAAMLRTTVFTARADAATHRYTSTSVVKQLQRPSKSVLPMI